MRKRSAFIASLLQPSMHISRILSIACPITKLNRRDDALEAGQEAVDLRRQLAAKNPAAFNSDLGSSLQNPSVLLSKAGDRKAALEASREGAALG
jgi:hypothetical protein